MAALMKSFAYVALMVFIVCSITNTVHGQLSSTFYDKSCPTALSIVKAAVKKAVAKEQRMGASLLRLHFHDCFVNGCSGVVSCANIVAIAARDSVVELGGPSWAVRLGRRDSRTTNINGANANLPPPNSNLSNLTSLFQAQGLSKTEMVALSGAHTIGLAQCKNFRDHIYLDSKIDKTYAASLRSKCPKTSGSGDSNLSPLDYMTPTVFDNNYYVNLKNQKGLYRSDQALFNGGPTDSQVTTYSSNNNKFFSDFVVAMI